MPANCSGPTVMKGARVVASQLVRRLLQRDDGTAAVEFGLVIVPFLGLMFAILETALVFFASQVLETAVADSARLILTGQADSAGYNATTFKTQVCNRLLALFNCSNIQLDVRTTSSFSSADLSLPLVPDPLNPGKMKVDTSNFAYQSSTPGQIVVVRVVYEWPTFVTGLGLNLSTLSDGNRLLMSTAAFRNEPYK
jgi:Flp pilus assembly protein TadG